MDYKPGVRCTEFGLFVGIVILASVLLWYGKISEGTWAPIITIGLTAYTGQRALLKIKAPSEQGTVGP